MNPIVYVNYTPEEFRARLGESLLSGLANGEVAGAYDQAFEYPAIRAYYITHWVLTILVGSALLISVQKVTDLKSREY